MSIERNNNETVTRRLLRADAERAVPVTLDLWPRIHEQVDRRSVPVAQPIRQHRRRWASPHKGVAFAGAALLLVSSGIAGYMQFQGPQPVSAQVLLQRAVAESAVKPDSVTHQVWDLTSHQQPELGHAGSTVRQHIEVWTQVDHQGVAIREAGMTRDSTGGVQITLRDGSITQQYNPSTRTLTISTPAAPTCRYGRPRPAQEYRMPMLLDRSFVLTAARSRHQELRLLPPRTLGGIRVYVVEINRRAADFATQPAAQAPVWYRETVRLYLDMQTYLIRGQDITRFAARGEVVSEVSMRIKRYEVLPLSAVGADVFRLHVPATAHVARTLTPPPSCLLTVAEAMELPRLPAPLLSGSPLGLHLAQIEMDDTVGLTQNGCVSPALGLLPTVPAIVYSYGTGGYQATTPTFCVAASLTAGLTLSGLLTTARRLPVSLGGQRVQARYFKIAGATGGVSTHILWGRINGKIVVISGAYMTEREFFTTIGRLVDGHAKAEVVTRLQSDLDHVHPGA